MRDINLGIADFFRYKQELNKLARLFVTLSSIYSRKESPKTYLPQCRQTGGLVENQTHKKNCPKLAAIIDQIMPTASPLVVSILPGPSRLMQIANELKMVATTMAAEIFFPRHVITRVAMAKMAINTKRFTGTS